MVGHDLFAVKETIRSGGPIRVTTAMASSSSLCLHLNRGIEPVPPCMSARHVGHRGRSGGRPGGLTCPGARALDPGARARLEGAKLPSQGTRSTKEIKIFYSKGLYIYSVRSYRRWVHGLTESACLKLLWLRPKPVGDMRDIHWMKCLKRVLVCRVRCRNKTNTGRPNTEAFP